jgi:hypothetical protein
MREPATWPILAAGLLASALPFLASHIDLRYTIPPSQAMALFAGLGAVELLRARRRPALLALAVPLTVWALGVPWLTLILPSLPPWYIHLGHTAALCLAFVIAGWLLGGTLTHGANTRRPATLASGLAIGLVLAGTYGVQALYEGDWHQWSTTLRPQEAVRQTIDVPPDWAPPTGGRAEVRLYVAGSPKPTYEPVVRVNGHEAARLGLALTEAGPLRFWEKIMVAARNQGRARAEVPQWIAVPLDLRELAAGSVEIELSVESAESQNPGKDAALSIWGDHTPRPGVRLYEGPPAYSRIQGQDEAFLKYVATGEYGIWRWQYLRSVNVRSEVRSGTGAWRSDDLSASAPGRQAGEYRIRIVVYAANGDLAALF